MTTTYEKSKALVDKHVLYNVSTLIEFLYKAADLIEPEDQEELYHLSSAFTDYEQAARDAGWMPVPQDKTLFTDGDTAFLADEDDYAALVKHLGIFCEYEEDADLLCGEEGWYDSEATFMLNGGAEFSEARSWDELCEEQGIEPYEGEAYEHWLVTDLLGDKLKFHGYTVVDIFGMTVWARGTTGQAIYMDSAIQEIAKEFSHD